MLTAGDRIDNWQVVQLLGEGGFGAVYRCKDAVTGMQAAVKVMLTRSLTADMAERFRREIGAVAQLSHTSIVRALGWGEDREHKLLYLAMELVEGEDMAQRLERGGLPMETFLLAFSGLAGALVCAHDAGVFHRDIKPHNVRLRPNGEAVLIDFGIALQREQTRLTFQGQMVGSPAYMPHEALRGDPVDPAQADVYALGVMMYEALTGLNGFPVDPNLPASKQIMRVLDGKRENKTLELPGHFPQPLRLLVSTASSPHPAQRYQSAEELLEQLEAFQASRSDGTLEEDTGFDDSATFHFLPGDPNMPVIDPAPLIEPEPAPVVAEPEPSKGSNGVWVAALAVPILAIALLAMLGAGLLMAWVLWPA